MLLADRPTTSRWTPPQGERSYRVRPILEGKNRGRHFVRKTLSPRSNRILSQTSVQPSTLREPSPTRATEIQHRDCIRCRLAFGGAPPSALAHRHERDHQLGAGRRHRAGVHPASRRRPSGAHRPQRRRCQASCAGSATLRGPLGCVDRCERETWSSSRVVAFDRLVAAGAVGAAEPVDEVAHVVARGGAPGGAAAAVLEAAVLERDW